MVRAAIFLSENNGFMSLLIALYDCITKGKNRRPDHRDGTNKRVADDKTF